MVFPTAIGLSARSESHLGQRPDDDFRRLPKTPVFRSG
jgi:hypothetical protein